MSEPWTSERTVSLAAARDQIESQFPELAPVTVEPLGEGWDDIVLRVNGHWAFHFPRRQMGADLIETEAALLRQLPDMPLAIPRTEFVGTSPDETGWPFVGFQCLEGSTWCRAGMGDEERTANAPRLGEFLRHLHDYQITSEIAAMVPVDKLRRLDLNLRRAKAHQYLQRALATGNLDSGEKISQFLDHDLDNLPSPRDDTLVHGDLYSRHLIVDAALRLVGVIDWGDVHRGDPAIDLAIAHLVLPTCAHEEFLKTYGHVSESTWCLARFRAVQHALLTLVFAHETQDDALARESLQGLEFIFGPLTGNPDQKERRT